MLAILMATTYTNKGLRPSMQGRNGDFQQDSNSHLNLLRKSGFHLSARSLSRRIHVVSGSDHALCHCWLPQIRAYVLRPHLSFRYYKTDHGRTYLWFPSLFFFVREFWHFAQAVAILHRSCCVEVSFLLQPVAILSVCRFRAIINVADWIYK